MSFIHEVPRLPTSWLSPDPDRLLKVIRCNVPDRVPWLRSPSMKETGELFSRVGKDNLSCAISLLEMESNGLALLRMHDHRQLIGHVQIENVKSAGGEQRCPCPDDGHNYRPFLKELKAVGCSGLISLPDDADAAGLEFCRRSWKE